MLVNTSALEPVIKDLINSLRLEDCIDGEEWALSQELGALPLFFSLYAYVLLLPYGTVVSTGHTPDELDFDTTEHGLITALAFAMSRWPVLASFIPSRPDDAIDCYFCKGTGKTGTIVGSNPPRFCTCSLCAGLRWVRETA